MGSKIEAKVEIWNYIFGFTPMAVVKCAIELQIADVLESHGGLMTLPELSSSLGCSQSTLYRIMRYLIHRGIFNTQTNNQESSSICYIQTALSRLLMQTRENNMAALICLESSPVMLEPWHKLSSYALENSPNSPFVSAHGDNMWDYLAKNEGHNKLFNDAMGSHARVALSEIVGQYPEAFEGINGVLVDVGGGDGTTIRSLVEGFPRIRSGINFDLPHVVSAAQKIDGIENVEGDMFEFVPKADAVFIMWVLHDWSDEECIKILKNCIEAIPKKTGKVIIVEAVIDEEREDEKYDDIRLSMDMVLLAHTEKGKERTIKEWEYVVNEAGFTRFTVKHIQSIISIIEAYP